MIAAVTGFGGAAGVRERLGGSQTRWVDDDHLTLASGERVVANDRHVTAGDDVPA